MESRTVLAEGRLKIFFKLCCYFQRILVTFFLSPNQQPRLAFCEMKLDPRLIKNETQRDVVIVATVFIEIIHYQSLLPPKHQYSMLLKNLFFTMFMRL